MRHRLFRRLGLVVLLAGALQAVLRVLRASAPSDVSSSPSPGATARRSGNGAGVRAAPSARAGRPPEPAAGADPVIADEPVPATASAAEPDGGASSEVPAAEATAAKEAPAAKATPAKTTAPNASAPAKKSPAKKAPAKASAKKAAAPAKKSAAKKAPAKKAAKKSTAKKAEPPKPEAGS